MSAPIVQAQYDSLEEIAKRFDQQASNTDKMARHLIQMLDQLQDGGWEGDSAQAFFREMNDEVLPTTNNLQNAFTEAGETTRQIVNVLQAAEDEAANQFQITNEGGQSDNTVIIPASYNEGDEKGFWSKAWDATGEWVHGGLDIAGLVPGFGEAADGINGLIYLAEGRKLEAGLSFGAMIPIAGWGATAGKVGVRVGREVAEEGAERIVREGVEEGAERGVREVADDLPLGGRGPKPRASNADGFGTHVGEASGRPFNADIESIGLPIERLNPTDVPINSGNIDNVVQHLERFGPDTTNDAAIKRLRDIADGKIPATEYDYNFISHELREYDRYKALGWPKGQPTNANDAHKLWNDTHTATLEDYGIRDNIVYHPSIKP